MTEEVEKQAYQISEDEKSDIRKSESIPSVDDMTSDLRGNQMNSEMQEAWVSSIVPPSEDLPDAPKTTNIAVEFILPSGLMGEKTQSDTFWEIFEYPENRWPEDNEFRQFIEELGYYDVDQIPQLIGDSVDTKYDERRNEWTIDMDFVEGEEHNESSQQETTNKELALRGTAIITGFLFAIFAIAILKHMGIMLVIVALIVSAVIYNQEY